MVCEGAEYGEVGG